MRYVALFRGINVGGKNKVPMDELKECLEKLGYGNVSTYIASGNAFLESDKPADQIQSEVEETLPKTFKLDSELVKVLLLTPTQLQSIIDNKPRGFGEENGTYHSDVIFLMSIDVEDALAVFDPRDGIDTIWPGETVIYSQRLSAERTKSRLNKIVGTPAYKSMTIRTWGTVQKLLELIQS